MAEIQVFISLLWDNDVNGPLFWQKRWTSLAQEVIFYFLEVMTLSDFFTLEWSRSIDTLVNIFKTLKDVESKNALILQCLLIWVVKNSPTMADSKLLIGTQSWRKVLTFGAQARKSWFSRSNGSGCQLFAQRPCKSVAKGTFLLHKGCLDLHQLQKQAQGQSNCWQVTGEYPEEQLHYVCTTNIFLWDSSADQVCAQAWGTQWRVLRAEGQWQSRSSLVESGSLEPSLQPSSMQTLCLTRVIWIHVSTLTKEKWQLEAKEQIPSFVTKLPLLIPKPVLSHQLFVTSW